MPITRELTDNDRAILAIRAERKLRYTDLILRLQADQIELPNWNEDPTTEEMLRRSLLNIAIDAISTLNELNRR